MKIFDCFMYFDEDIVLDVRLNYLDKYIDQFILILIKFVSIYSGHTFFLKSNTKTEK